MKNIILSFETLRKNFDPKNNILYEYNIDYYLVTNRTIFSRFKIMWWCFKHGIYPIKIYTGAKLFKQNPYSYRRAILNVQKLIPDEVVIFVSDELKDIDSIRDLSNIAKAKFETFELHAKKHFSPNIKPFT